MPLVQEVGSQPLTRFQVLGSHAWPELPLSAQTSDVSTIAENSTEQCWAWSQGEKPLSESLSRSIVSDSSLSMELSRQEYWNG